MNSGCVDQMLYFSIKGIGQQIYLSPFKLPPDKQTRDSENTFVNEKWMSVSRLPHSSCMRQPK